MGALGSTNGPERSARNRAARTIPPPATSVDNIARLLQDQGEFAGARPVYEPQQSPVASGLRRSCRARPLYQRTLTICENALGAEHPDTATRLYNLAGLLQTIQFHF